MWHRLKELKELYPIQLAEFAVAREIDTYDLEFIGCGCKIQVLASLNTNNRLTSVLWDFYQFDWYQPKSGDSSFKIGLSPVCPILHTANKLSTLIIP